MFRLNASVPMTTLSAGSPLFLNSESFSKNVLTFFLECT